MNRARFPLLRWLLAGLVVAGLLAAMSPVAEAGAGVTKKQVRKIARAVAGDVVTDEASKLSVADAQRLGGQPPSAYLNTAYTFVLPVGSASGSKEWTFGTVPPGAYLASYRLLIGGSAGLVDCYLDDTAVSPVSAEAFAYSTASGGAYKTVGGDTLLQVQGAPRLSCLASSGTFGVAGGDPAVVSRVTFTRVGPVVPGTPG
jgi:hypothetical protein